MGMIVFFSILYLATIAFIVCLKYLQVKGNEQHGKTKNGVKSHLSI